MTQEEFGNISKRLRDRLTSLARRFGEERLSPDSAEDIVQEAMAKLWELFQSSYPVSDPEALAVTLTKNICIAHYRKRRVLFQSLEVDASSSETASSRLDAEDVEYVRGKMYSELTDTQRLCLRLRNEDGLTLDEIALVTGKPKSSVKTTISTARKLMLERLKKEVL